MNLVLLLGAAVGSEPFAESLFENPSQAAALLNVALTATELSQLQETFRADNKELLIHFGTIRARLCKNPPCPAYQVAIPPKGSDVRGKAA